MSMKPCVHILAMLLFVIGMGCGTKRSTDQTIFTYNQPEGISSLDPAFVKNQSVMWAVHQLYSTLVEVDEKMEIRPGVAHSWDISPDRLSFTFHLRTDTAVSERRHHSPFKTLPLPGNTALHRLIYD